MSDKSRSGKLSPQEASALRSLRGCAAASARSVVKCCDLTESKAEEALRKLVKLGRATRSRAA